MRNTCPVWLRPFSLRNASATSSAGSPDREHGQKSPQSTEVDFDIEGNGEASRPTLKPIIVPTSDPRTTESDSGLDSNSVKKSQPSHTEEVIESAAAIYDAQKWRGIDRTAGTRSTSISTGSSDYRDSAWGAGFARGFSSISGSGKSSRSFTVSGAGSRQTHLLGGSKADCEAR